mmetsp:Transcript_4175/g.10581  ORF Transcript_4175/g.10581 Transcript_4175/m.10581 type:complete len:86 (-) Transcript_4175:514-771(-)
MRFKLLCAGLQRVGVAVPPRAIALRAGSEAAPASSAPLRPDRPPAAIALARAPSTSRTTRRRQGRNAEPQRRRAARLPLAKRALR